MKTFVIATLAAVTAAIGIKRNVCVNVLKDGYIQEVHDEPDKGFVIPGLEAITVTCTTRHSADEASWAREPTLCSVNNTECLPKHFRKFLPKKVDRVMVIPPACDVLRIEAPERRWVIDQEETKIHTIGKFTKKEGKNDNNHPIKHKMWAKPKGDIFSEVKVKKEGFRKHIWQLQKLKKEVQIIEIRMNGNKGANDKVGYVVPRLKICARDPRLRGN